MLLGELRPPPLVHGFLMAVGSRDNLGPEGGLVLGLGEPQALLPHVRGAPVDHRRDLGVGEPPVAQI